MGARFWLGVAAYIVPTFPLGYFWHLTWFAPRYHALAMYREDVVIPLGLVSMAVQAVIFSWAFGRLFAERSGGWLGKGLVFGAGAGLLSWSFTTLAVGAKHVMASVSEYMALESAFTAVQFAVVGPLIALAWRPGKVRTAAHAA